MIIGIPKEIMSGENRVACVPDVVPKLIKAGFEDKLKKMPDLKPVLLMNNLQKQAPKLLILLNSFFRLQIFYLKFSVRLKIQLCISTNWI